MLGSWNPSLAICLCPEQHLGCRGSRGHRPRPQSLNKWMQQCELRFSFTPASRAVILCLLRLQEIFFVIFPRFIVVKVGSPLKCSVSDFC